MVQLLPRRPYRLRLPRLAATASAIFLLLATLVLAASPLLAEDTSAAQGRALFREIESVQIGEDQIYFLAASQKIDGQNYQLRYNGQFPGQQMRTLPGDQVRIRLFNYLQGIPVEVLKRLRPCVVGSSDGQEMMELIAESSSVTNLHTHGLHVSPSERSDNVMLKIERGNENTYRIDLPKEHAPGTHWYHAHLHGSTAVQVQGGMAGALIVDPLPGQSLNPPGYHVQERVMVLQFGAGWDDSEDNTGCKGFDSTELASLSPEEQDQLEALVGVESSAELLAFASRLEAKELGSLVASLERLRSTLPPILVNGVENPVLDVQQDVAVQRLRVINAGSRRQDYKKLWIESTTDPDVGLPMYVGAFDGVNLTKLPRDAEGYIAYTKDRPLELAPGNRADIFVMPQDSGSFTLMMEGEIGVRDDEDPDEGLEPAPETLPLTKLRPVAERVKFRRALLTLEVGGPDFSARLKSAAEGSAEEIMDTTGFLEALDRHLQELQRTIPAYATGYLRPFEDDGDFIERTIRFNVIPANPPEMPQRSFRINNRDYNAPDEHKHGTAGDDPHAMMAGHSDYLGKVEDDGGRGPEGETPWPLRSGTEEEWVLLNESTGPHPFHIHVSPFWVLDIVEEVKQEDGTKKLVSVLETNPDDPRLNRWQDTINLPPNGGSVRVRHRVSEFTGVYVVHCHILQHEDRGMMINILTVPHNDPDPQLYFKRTMDRNAQINREINP